MLTIGVGVGADVGVGVAVGVGVSVGVGVGDGGVGVGVGDAFGSALKLPMRRRHPVELVVGTYSFTNQKVRSSVGSTEIAV